MLLLNAEKTPMRMIVSILCAAAIAVSGAEKKITNTEFGLTLSFPESWEAWSYSTYCVVGREGSVTVCVEAGDLREHTSLTDYAKRRVAQSIPGMNYEVVEAGEVKLGEVTAYRASHFNLPGPNGRFDVWTTYYIIAGKRIYRITAEAHDADQKCSKEIESIVNSFKLRKASDATANDLAGAVKTVVNKEMGFEIAYPAKWTVKEQTLHREILLSAMGPMSHGALSRPSLSVSRDELRNPVELNSFAAAKLAAIAKSEANCEVELSAISLAGRNAYKAKLLFNPRSSTFGFGNRETPRYKKEAYFFVAEKYVYIISAWARNDDYDKYIREIESIVGSLKIENTE